jgi:hypothetical protein
MLQISDVITTVRQVRENQEASMQARSPSQKVRRYSSNGAFTNRSTVDTVL